MPDLATITPAAVWLVVAVVAALVSAGVALGVSSLRLVQAHDRTLGVVTQDLQTIAQSTRDLRDSVRELYHLTGDLSARVRILEDRAQRRDRLEGRRG